MSPRLALLACLLSAGLAAAPSSFTAYFREPRADRVAMAPDGLHLAYDDVPRDGRPGRIVIVALDSSHTPREVALEEGPLRADGRQRFDRVCFLQWATSGRLVVGTALGRVYSLDVDGLNERAYRPAKARRRTEDADADEPAPPALARVARLPQGDPRHAILELHRGEDLDQSSAVGLVRFDVETGATETLEYGPAWGGSGHLLYDWQGRPRVLLGPFDSARPRYSVSLAPQGWSRWSTLGATVVGSGLDFEWRPEAVPPVTAFPLGFDSASSQLYVASRAGDSCRLLRLDLSAHTVSDVGAPAGEPELFQPDPRFGDEPVIFDRGSGQVVGVRVGGIEPGTVWFDPQFKRLQADLEEVFPRKSVRLCSWDDSRSVVVAWVYDDSDLGRYFIVRADATDLPQEILRRMPRLGADDLSPTAAFDLPADGGGRVRGYLSVPRARKATPFPVVFLLPSGPADGPVSGYDAPAQALASLGLAVVRVDDRSRRSEGPGGSRLARTPGALALLLGGLARSLAARYPVDPARLAIVGEGFGGVLAAHAAAQKPENFLAAVSLGPYADLTAWSRARIDGPDRAFAGAQREALVWALGPSPEWSGAGNAVPVLTQTGAVAAFAALGFRAEGYDALGRPEDDPASGRAALYWRLGEFLRAHGIEGYPPRGGWFSW